MQPASVTPETIDRIVAIGQERRPIEACGVILPGQVVIELPNKAATTFGAYEIDSDDLVRAIAAHWLTEDCDNDISRSDIVVWHTHPSGHVGPSDRDLETKADGFRYVVVTLPNGEATIF